MGKSGNYSFVFRRPKALDFFFIIIIIFLNISHRLKNILISVVQENQETIFLVHFLAQTNMNNWLILSFKWQFLKVDFQTTESAF